MAHDEPAVKSYLTWVNAWDAAREYFSDSSMPDPRLVVDEKHYEAARFSFWTASTVDRNLTESELEVFRAREVAPELLVALEKMIGRTLTLAQTAANGADLPECISNDITNARFLTNKARWGNEPKKKKFHIGTILSVTLDRLLPARKNGDFLNKEDSFDELMSFLEYVTGLKEVSTVNLIRSSILARKVIERELPGVRNATYPTILDTTNSETKRKLATDFVTYCGEWFGEYHFVGTLDDLLP